MLYYDILFLSKLSKVILIFFWGAGALDAGGCCWCYGAFCLCILVVKCYVSFNIIYFIRVFRFKTSLSISEHKILYLSDSEHASLRETSPLFWYRRPGKLSPGLSWRFQTQRAEGQRLSLRSAWIFWNGMHQRWRLPIQSLKDMLSCCKFWINWVFVILYMYLHPPSIFKTKGQCTLLVFFIISPPKSDALKHSFHFQSYFELLVSVKGDQVLIFKDFYLSKLFNLFPKMAMIKMKMLCTDAWMISTWKELVLTWTLYLEEVPK